MKYDVHVAGGMKYEELHNLDSSPHAAFVFFLFFFFSFLFISLKDKDCATRAHYEIKHLFYFSS
jgi:hypothetical protein